MSLSGIQVCVCVCVCVCACNLLYSACVCEGLRACVGGVIDLAAYYICMGES